MGGMGGMFASQSAQAVGKGSTLGWSTGSGIATAQYNAAAMRMQAESIDKQSEITASLIREQYAQEYGKLLRSQEQQQSWNRVMASKRGITGDSANAVMQSYAMRAQKNLETLYYNAAMQTGKNSLEYGTRSAALYEKARQYDWQATNILIGGAINLAAGYFDQAIAGQNMGQESFSVNEKSINQAYSSDNTQQVNFSSNTLTPNQVLNELRFQGYGGGGGISLGYGG